MDQENMQMGISHMKGEADSMMMEKHHEMANQSINFALQNIEGNFPRPFNHSPAPDFNDTNQKEN